MVHDTQLAFLYEDERFLKVGSNGFWKSYTFRYDNENTIKICVPISYPTQLLWVIGSYHQGTRPSDELPEWFLLLYEKVGHFLFQRDRLHHLFAT